MSPHYDRSTDVSTLSESHDALGGGPDDDAMDDAAEALRQAELEAVQTDADVARADLSHLDRMSIDDLRALAAALDVPDRATITEQDELIAAIRQRL